MIKEKATLASGVNFLFFALLGIKNVNPAIIIKAMVKIRI